MSNATLATLPWSGFIFVSTDIVSKKLGCSSLSFPSRSSRFHLSCKRRVTQRCKSRACLNSSLKGNFEGRSHQNCNHTSNFEISQKNGSSETKSEEHLLHNTRVLGSAALLKVQALKMKWHPSMFQICCASYCFIKGIQALCFSSILRYLYRTLFLLREVKFGSQIYVNTFVAFI